MGYVRGKRWNEKEIEDRIMQIVNDMGMDTFPTLSEMTEYYGNQGLRNKVSKTGGSFAWAEKLGLPMKQSDTCFGRKYELYAIEDIYKHTYHMRSEKMSTRYPYDLLVEGLIKVDVKVSRPAGRLLNGNRYSFNSEKKHQTCDIFLLYGLDDDGQVIKTFIIPSFFIYGTTQINIGASEKWDVFLDRWDIFHEYMKFQKDITEKVLSGHKPK